MKFAFQAINRCFYHTITLTRSTTNIPFSNTTSCWRCWHTLDSTVPQNMRNTCRQNHRHISYAACKQYKSFLQITDYTKLYHRAEKRYIIISSLYCKSLKLYVNKSKNYGHLYFFLINQSTCICAKYNLYHIFYALGLFLHMYGVYTNPNSNSTLSRLS
jgi:hypothetical protein